MISSTHECLNCQRPFWTHDLRSGLCADYPDRFEPVTYCAACHDEQVDSSYNEVCNLCRNSTPEDWLDLPAYNNMLQMVALIDFVPIAVEANAILRSVPSYQEAL